MGFMDMASASINDEFKLFYILYYWFHEGRTWLWVFKVRNLWKDSHFLKQNSCRKGWKGSNYDGLFHITFSSPNSQCTGSVSMQMAAVILYFCLIWLQYNVFHCWPLQWWISDNMQDVQYSANVLIATYFFWICCFQWARLPCKFVYVKDCYWLLFILQLILFTERPHGFQLGQLEKRKCSLWFKPKDFHLTEVWFYVIKVNKECRQWAWWKFHFNLCVRKTFFFFEWSAYAGIMAITTATFN